MSEASVYQQLRGHLAELRLTAAAEALPGELDHAGREQRSATPRSWNGSSPSRSTATDSPPAGQPGPVRLPARALAARRLRLRRPALGRPQARHRAGHPAVPRRRHQRAADRPARRRQDHARRRPGPRRRRRRLPHLLHHRRRPGRPLPPRRDRGPLGHHHAVLRRAPAPDRRRGRLPAAAGRRRRRAVPGHHPAALQRLHRADHQPGHRRPGERSSTTRWSPPPCSTGCCTDPSSSTSPASPTGCAPTGPAPTSSAPGTAPHDQIPVAGRRRDDDLPGLPAPVHPRRAAALLR